MKNLIVIIALYSCLIFPLSYGAGLDGQAACAWGSSNQDRRKMRRSVDDEVSMFSVSEEDIKFLLYNKERYLGNEPYPIQLFINDEASLMKGDFDVKKLTKIFIHGFKSHYNKSASRLTRDGFLKSGDFNVIVIDWNRAQYWGIGHVIPSTYSAVVKRLDGVAVYVSRMLQFLESYGMNLNTTTIVGHSLGAHIAGLASHKVNSKIGRIVGLDPAAPLMSDKGPSERLSKDDAVRVEVIHSEIDQCGLKDQMGHYDFYPNSGCRQPGCTTYKCSHARSYQLFAESLDPTSNGFYGNLCADWSSMKEGNCKGPVLLMGGLESKTAEHGLYYVKTNDHPPYALGRLHIALPTHMITEQDLKLFNSDVGLWFLNDEGQMVQATLDMPVELTKLGPTVETSVKFFLYTRKSKDPELIYIDDFAALKKTHFDPKRQTKFITHGWINSKNSKACTLIRDAYLQKGDYNVIVVDWSRYTLRPYGWAATHVIDVGKYTAKMVDFLEVQGIDLLSTVLVGHSLGAHVMGLAGYYAKGRINYVVGLDPALPLFAFAGPGSRISKEDAEHVEIIHTNAGLLGYPSAIGKADFYPNGGRIQAGCVFDITGVCSHERSYEFYAESVNSKEGFYGIKCKDYESYSEGKCRSDEGVMGGVKIYLPFNGTYYLDTRSENPFAKGRSVKH